jgi:predicted NodU family carbamoyl transferase
MRILAFNKGHDLGTVCVDDGKLVFAREAEKDGEKGIPWNFRLR